MKLEINGKEYPLIYNLRTVFTFEGISGKRLSMSLSRDWAILVYSAILSATKDLDFTFDDFISLYDNDPHLIQLAPAIKWLRKQIEVANQFGEVDKEDGSKKK